MDVFTTRRDPHVLDLDSLPAQDARDTLIVVFGDADVLDDPVTVLDLLDRYPGAHAVGCSTPAQIVGDSAAERSLALAIVRFDSTRLVTAAEPVSGPEESFEAGLRLGRRLADQEPELQAVFALSDGLGVNGSALAEGLAEGTGGGVPISGGLAGDDARFERTWVLADGAPRSGQVAALGLAGPHLVVSHGSQGGWAAFGPVRRVTRATGNVLHELDDEPALALYARYLGDRAAGLPATALLFPLAVQPPGRRAVVRTVLSIDPAAQSMTFAGDVPVGSSAQLMTGSLDRLVAGARAAAAAATIGTIADGAGTTLAVAVSCVGRRLALGRRTDDEVEAVLAGLPAGSDLIGFYSYGELAPVGGVGGELHNQAMTVTTFAENG